MIRWQLVVVGAVLAALVVAWFGGRRRVVGASPVVVATWRALLAILCAAVIIVAAVDMVPTVLVGIGPAVAPTAGVAMGLLLFALIPARDAGAVHAVRTATLEPRRPWSFVTRGAMIRFSVWVLTLVTALVWCGVTADGRGRELVVETSTRGASASPYPGWYYGIPLIVSTLVLFGTVVVALWRVSSTPVIVANANEGVDRRLREASSRIIVGVAEFGMLLTIGGVIWFAGRATASVAYNLPSFEMERVAGVGLTWIGFGAVAASIVMFIVTASRAFTLARDVMAPVGHGEAAA